MKTLFVLLLMGIVACKSATQPPMSIQSVGGIAPGTWIQQDTLSPFITTLHFVNDSTCAVYQMKRADSVMDTSIAWSVFVHGDTAIVSWIRPDSDRWSFSSYLQDDSLVGSSLVDFDSGGYTHYIPQVFRK